jgi:titin
LGDDSSDRQFRVILSFDTAPLPDTASIVSATLRLRRGGLSGTTPFQTHGTCWVDVKGDTGFGGATGIAAGDFQAAADATRVASLSAASSNGSWSEGAVSAAGLPFVNRTGRTQFRVYFNLDDNDDRGTDYVGYYPGEYSTTSYRPQLVVTYSTIAPTAPVAPVGLTATPVSATQIALAWQDAAGDETGYQLERSTDGVNWFLLASLAANVSAYVDSALAPETSYRYRVRAINGAGNSGWSNVAVATTLADVPPAPSGLTATAGSETQIALTWSDNATNETGYSLERSADGVTWVELIALPANATSHLDAGLPPASTWYYRVRALNAVGASPYSEIATATTWAPNVAPVAADDAYTTPEDTVLVIAAPGLLGNDTDANVEDTLTVVSHSSPAHGTVSVSSNGAFSYSPAPDYHGADSFAYTISDGRGGTASATVALSVLPVADLPAAPTGLTATAISASAINLAWLDEAGNETGFEVERSADGGSQWSLLAVLPANTTAFGDSGLAAGATYLYRVRATNADGPSAWSNVASAATFPPAPGAPSGLVATATSASQIALTWTDNASNESGFRLERSVDALTWTQVAALGSNVVTYTDSGLSSATTYYYRVRAWNAGGDSAWSNLANATTLAPLVTVTFQGLGGEDGFILEASETANTGSTAYASDSNGSAVRSGDNYQDRQYRSIVSFDTSSLPDGATIVSAKLRLRRGALAGTNPFETHGICWVDIKGGSGFNGSSALSKEDFEAPADAARVGTLSNAPTTDAWSEAVIGSAGLPFVNRTGRTQFRFYFDLDDNDDSGTDYIGWYSGENSTADNRPQLVIEYR